MTRHGLRIVEADSWWARARGLLGRPPPDPGHALRLRPCGAVHTLGMAYAIDVVFVGRDGRVRRCCAAVPPGRVRGCAGAVSVLELRAGAIDALGIAVGDEIVATVPRT